MIKLTFVAASTQGGGAERMQLNIMHSLQEDKYDITFINTGRDKKPSDLKANIDYKHYGKANVRKSYRNLKADLKAIQPKYVFTTSIVIAYLLQFIRMVTGLKYQLIVRIAVPPSESVHTNLKSKVLRQINSLTLRYADRVIAQTKFSKTDIAKHYRVPLNKIQVIRNIVDKEMLDKKGAEFNPEEILSENYNIVAAGALYSVKGFDLLIDAIKQVVLQNKEVKLFILGGERYEAGYKDILQQQIINNDLENNVFLLGHQLNPYPYYKNADLFVLSSRKEGFPNVVLEALYYGTPVVATNCVDFSEVINNGVNGYIVHKNSVNDLSDGIINAINQLKKTKDNKIENYNYEQIFI